VVFRRARGGQRQLQTSFVTNFESRGCFGNGSIALNGSVRR
jgi:hypothetical protein